MFSASSACRIVLLLAAGCVHAPASGEAAGRPWRQLETPNFTVISQLRDEPTRVWAEEFNQFTAELHRTFRAERAHLPPLTVVLFARERDLNPYKPLRSDGRGPAPTAGFFHHRGNWSVIGLAHGYTRQATRELIFHEGVHWFTSNDSANYPLWLAEGMAEVFSTFQQSRGSVRWGTDIPDHVRLLRTDEMMPLEKLLFMTREHPLFDERKRTGMFYAQSWAFVHYLMFGERDGSRDAISDYFDLLGTETHPDEAFRQAFGQDYAAMGDTLATYIRDGHYYKVSRPESPAARITTTPQPASPAAVDVALARLAIATNRHDVARPHVTQAIAFAPQQPAGYELLTLLEQEAGDDAGAHAACARAVELGSRDATTLFLFAFFSARAELNAGGIAEPAVRRIATFYQEAIRESPMMAEAYQNFAALAPSLGRGDDADLATLRQGARLFPHRGDIVLGLAMLVAQRGDRTTARKLIAAARQRGLPLDSDRQARRLEDGWEYEEAVARIEALAKNGDHAGALAACDGAIAQISDVYVRASLVRIRQALATRAQLAVAEHAQHHGDLAGARRGYEAVLADPATPAGMRAHIEDILRRLPADSTP